MHPNHIDANGSCPICGDPIYSEDTHCYRCETLMAGWRNACRDTARMQWLLDRMAGHIRSRLFGDELFGSLK